MQVTTYLGGFYLLCGIGYSALCVITMLQGFCILALLQQGGLKRELLEGFVYAAPALTVLMAYLILLYRGTAAAKYANR
jgi:hypothetical protein